jgi:2-haloacid dehalogenase
MTIKAVVFDAYGTLFDVYSIQTLAEQFYPGQGAAVSVMWRDKQIEYTRLITQSDPHQAEGSKYYLPFWEITRLALENLAVLKSLKKAGLTTAILSNGSPEMLESAVTSAGMKDLLHHVISVDAIKLFKTSPESYGLVQKYMPLEKQEILFVSSNAWDALGASWFGFTSLWVNRQGLPYETIGPKPTYTGRDLSKALEILELN